jgi:concanavalin A-like lectin/glucanase superfamily protein
MRGSRGRSGAAGRRVLATIAVAALVTAAAAACSSGPVETGGLLQPQQTTGSGPTDADLWLSFEDDTVAYDGATAYPDTGGGASPAKVVTANGGTVETVPGPDGSGLAVSFPSKCTQALGCPRAMLEVSSAPALDPGDADFEYGATVWLAADQTTHGSNIVQKGRFGTDGGQWKLQVDGDEGQPSCVVRGEESGAEPTVVRSTVTIADSTWHHVVCRRAGETLSVDVDGHVTQTSGPTGSVSSEWPVRVGSPGVGEGDDQFSGRVDDVFLRIARPG